jgi:hypothetical protein
VVFLRHQLQDAGVPDLLLGALPGQRRVYGAGEIRIPLVEFVLQATEPRVLLTDAAELGLEVAQARLGGGEATTVLGELLLKSLDGRGVLGTA